MSSIERIKSVYKYHHTAYARGYVSRKSDDYAVTLQRKIWQGFQGLYALLGFYKILLGCLLCKEQLSCTENLLTYRQHGERGNKNETFK